MSKPLGKSVLSELIGAMSSLKSIDNTEHSIEHIESSIDVLQEMRGELIQLKDAITRLDISKDDRYAYTDKINSIMGRF